MAYDFPATPNVGDAFTDPISGVTFIWNGYGWGGGAAGTGGPIIVGPTPPSPPKDNTLWWENDSGMLFVRYNDGNSSQWVQVNAAGGMNNYVAKAGDAMSGLLTLSGDPAVPLGASTKQYADTKLPLAGVTDGSNAPAGQIGEVISGNVGMGAAITTNTVTVITSIVLTPGDWDVQGEVWFTLGTGGATSVQAGTSTSATALIGQPGLATSRASINCAMAASSNVMMPLRTSRLSLTGTVTHYLLGVLGFPSGSCVTGGNLWARRAR